MKLDDVQIDKAQAIINERNRLRSALEQILRLVADRTVRPKELREGVAGIAAGAIAVSLLSTKDE